MDKRFARLIKTTLVVIGLFIFIGVFAYVSVGQTDIFVPARAATLGTTLASGNGMELGVNEIRTEANTSDGSQTGSGVFDGKDIYTGSGSYDADPNSLLYRPSANGQGIHAKVIFGTSYNTNNLYNAIKDTANNDFLTNASLSFNASVVDAGKTAKVTITFSWSPTGSESNETSVVRDGIIDNTNTFFQSISLNDIVNTSMSSNAYFRIKIIFTEMPAAMPQIRVSSFVVKADTTLTDSITLNNTSKYYISGNYRRTTALDTAARSTLDYQNILADTYVKAGDTITLQTKVFKGLDTSNCYQLPSIYATVFNDGGVSRTDPKYGVFWQQYSSYISASTGSTVDDTSLSYLTAVAANSGYKAVQEVDENGDNITVNYYQIEFTVNEGVRNAKEIVIVPQLLVKFDESGPSSSRGTGYIKQDPIRIKVDSTAPDSPKLSTTAGLGSAIANKNWYTASNTIDLGFTVSIDNNKAREYIYAFVCSDPNLVSITTSSYNFTPMLSDKISYLDSNGQMQESESRQEVTVYTQSTPGKYTVSYRSINFIDRSEQALVLFRVDIAGNVSIPTIYYGGNDTKVKVDSFQYTVVTKFLIGKDGDTYSQDLEANPASAANIDFFAGSAFHNPDGSLKVSPTYGYSNTYSTALKRDQWVTIRISVTANQAARYKLIRYKNEEADINEYSDSMVFVKGAIGRPDYIDIKFRMTDEFMQGNGIFMFYFRKNVAVNITNNVFIFNQGRTIGIDDYIESYDAGARISGLTYNSSYYKTLTYNVVPTYINDVMQDYGNISINQISRAYTGMLAVGNTITVTSTGEQFAVLRMTKQVVGGVTSYQTTFYKVGSGVQGGMIDVGEYYYKVDIDLSSTTVYFGGAVGFFVINKADPDVSRLKTKNTLTYGTADYEALKYGLSFLEFSSYDASDNEIDTAAFIINGISYYYTKSGVLGSYEIIDPVKGSQAYNNPDVSASMRIEVRFNPIPLADSYVFSQQTILQNISFLGQFYDYIDGVYVVKTGAYYDGNFSAKSYIIYATIVNADGNVTIQGIQNNVLDLVYDGSYKAITFITSPMAGLPVNYSFTLVDENNHEKVDEFGNPITYTRINNAGRYKITYSIRASACNYQSDDIESYVVINKRTLELTPVNYNEMQPEMYDDTLFTFFYGIKFGKVNAASLPKPESKIQGGALISVGYLYSYKMIKDHSGVGTINPQYSDYYLNSAFPITVSVGTYLLSIKVNDPNNQGELLVLMVINKVLSGDDGFVQAKPIPYSAYAVYNKDNTLQSYMGDSTQGHIEFGQTLAEGTQLMLGHIAATAIHRIGSTNTTVGGKFVFETETAIAARYNAQYSGTPSKQITLMTNYRGEKILPVRYDSGNTNTVSTYTIYLYWYAGAYNEIGEFEYNYNYDAIRYEIEITVARATATFDNVSFTSIIYGQPLSSSALVGRPEAAATGFVGLEPGSYTLTYTPYINIVYPKGTHSIKCVFTPQGNYINNYRMLNDVQIPLTVIAKEVHIELAAANRKLTYGTAYAAPSSSVYYETAEGTVYFPNPGSVLDYTYRDGAGNIVNMYTVLGQSSYVSAAPGTYSLTLTITSNDYMGSLTVDNFVVEKGTLVLLSDPTQEIIEYGTLIGDIKFYNGQCQNLYTRAAYSGTFSLIPLEGDATFTPEADRSGYSVIRQLSFLPSDTTLYTYYNEFLLSWKYKINKNSKDVSIVPKIDTLSAVYDGTNKPVDFNITYPGGTSATIKAATTVKYYSADGQIEYTRVPRDAGTYRVVISVNNDFLNYAGSVTTNLTIAKQAININFAERYHTYNGENQGFGSVDFGDYVGDEGAIKYTVQYFRYTGTSMYNEIPVDVGKYTARITINENNYSGTADINYYIIQSSITVSGWHYVYDDANKDISVTITPSLVDFTIRYRVEARNDEGVLIGAFTDTKPRDAGRYQVRIIINENGYYKEIDVFSPTAAGDNLYDNSTKLTIVQSAANEYAQKVATEGLSANYPLFMKIDKAFAVMTILPENQNKTVVYSGKGQATMVSLTPNYLIATYTYIACEFTLQNNLVVPTLVDGKPVPMTNTSKVVFDNYNRPVSVGYYIVTVALSDKDYRLGEYTQPTIKINPASLVIDTMPAVDGNIYYKQTEAVRFLAGSGQVRFVALGERVYGDWEIATDISALKVGTYGNIAVRFIPMVNGERDTNFVPPMGSITIAISKKDIGDNIYFTSGGNILSWDNPVVISTPYTQLQITCNALLDNAAAGIDAAYNNGKPLTLRVKYNGTYTAPTNVGEYTIEAELSDGNYQGVSRKATLIIQRAKPAIILPQASPIPVGSALSESSISSGLAYIASSINEANLRSIAGVFAFLHPETLMTKANGQKVWVVFTPTDLATYDVATFEIEIIIKGIDVSVAGVSATALMYGQTLKDSVLSYTGSSVPGTIKWYDQDTIPDVGIPARYKFVPDNSDVYNIIDDGLVLIDIQKAEMDYNPDTLLVKGYVGENRSDAINNIFISLWHADKPSLKVSGAVFELDLDYDDEINASKESYEARLIVTHPNYNPLEIYVTVNTYIYLGGDNFFIANKGKQYDGEPVTLQDLGIKLIGTEEQLDLSIFRLKVTKNGVVVSDMLDVGEYQVEITLLDEILDEDITMAYDGKCVFVYTISKKEFDGSGSQESNQIYIKGNTTVYGASAGEIEAYYQAKKYKLDVANTSKIYNGAALTVGDLGISILNSSDLPVFVITAIRKQNTSTLAYETVAQAIEVGQYIVTLSLSQNILMSLGGAPAASIDVPVSIVPFAARMAGVGDTYTIALYAGVDDNQVRLTFFSSDKLVEYGQSAPTSAGSYIVRVTFLSTNPYYAGSQEFTYTVAPMQIYTVLETSYNFEYGQNLVINPMFVASQGSGATLSNIGYTLQYAINSGGVWVTLNQPPVNAGNYRVSVVLTGTDYVLSEGDGVVRMDITQLKVLITTVPTLSNIIYGQELYNSIYSGGVAVLEKTGAVISGAFSFKEPNKNDLPAGDRTATLVFVPNNANYATVEINGVAIKVLKASASIECLELSLPYNGLEQQPVIKTNPVANLTVTYSYYQYINGQRQGVSKPKAAGNYEVVMTISDGNYQGTETATFIITKAKIQDDNVTVPTLDPLTYGQSLSYAAFVGGKAVNPASNAQITGSFRFTNIGLTLLGRTVEQGGVSGSGNLYGFVAYVSPDGSISDILGTYTEMPYRFVPDDTANYEIYESTIPVMLMKASATITVYDQLTREYGNKTSFVYGDIMPELTFLTYPMGLVVANTKYMATNGLFNTLPSAGTYEYRAQINDTNYTGELVYLVSVNKRKLQVEFFDSEGQITEWYSYVYAATHGAKARILVGGLLSQDLQRKDEIEMGLSYRYMQRNSSNNKVSQERPTLAGEYLVYAVLENEDYYIDSQALKPNYDITKARVEYLDFDASTLINIIYGSVQMPTVVTRPANISYKVSFPGYETMPKDAGTHKIKVVVDDPNFYPAEKTSMFYIYKKDISIDNIKVYDRPYDGTDVVAISGELTGLVLGNEVGLKMTARTINSATNPGVYGVEILTWTLSGLHAANYNVIKPEFNGTVKINQNMISDAATGSYITSEHGFSSNVTVSFKEVYSAQNKTTAFSSLFGQSAIVQTITVKELGLETVLDKKVKFHVLIPEKYRNSPTLQVEALGKLSEQSITFTREGDYMTFTADRSGEIVFYTQDFPYWIIVVGGGILMIIIGAILLAVLAPVRRRKRIPLKARDTYAAIQDYHNNNSYSKSIQKTKARRTKYLQ